MLARRGGERAPPPAHRSRIGSPSSHSPSTTSSWRRRATPLASPLTANGWPCRIATSRLPGATTRARTCARCSRRSTLLKSRGADVPATVIALDIDFPDDHRRVARAVEAAGLAANVTVVGMTGARQRAAVIAGADAFVYPALTDATAISVLEALAAGVPVISSKTGALPEAVGSAGIVVEPRDPARMASALEAIWAGGPLARQLRDHAGRRAAAAPRTWADVARRNTMRVQQRRSEPHSRPVETTKRTLRAAVSVGSRYADAP